VERSEFERLALEHLDSVHRMAMHLANDPDTAGDLVQETYLRALKWADRFVEKGGGIRPWLFTILHNVHRTRLKRESRAPVAMGDFYSADAKSHEAGVATPAWDLKSMDWEQVDERLKAAIDELRPEFRVILLLWGVEGLKYRQIAEVMEMPIGTVMSRLHRARQMLAASLEGVVNDLGVRAGEVSADD